MYQEQAVVISERCRVVLAKLARQWGVHTYGQVIERLALEQETREQLREYAESVKVRDDGIVEIIRRLRDDGLPGYVERRAGQHARGVPGF